jgi:hypothetical protein
MPVQEVPAVKAVRRLRYRQAVDRLDELRLIQSLAESMSQSALAEALSISQPAIHKALRKAEGIGRVPDGFSGASPFEVAERYAAGLIGRTQVVRELAAWDYAPSPSIDPLDWLTAEAGGTFREVVRALTCGLIDESIYEEVIAITEAAALDHP